MPQEIVQITNWSPDSGDIGQEALTDVYDWIPVAGGWCPAPVLFSDIPVGQRTIGSNKLVYDNSLTPETVVSDIHGHHIHGSFGSYGAYGNMNEYVWTSTGIWQKSGAWASADETGYNAGNGGGFTVANFPVGTSTVSAVSSSALDTAQTITFVFGNNAGSTLTTETYTLNGTTAVASTSGANVYNLLGIRLSAATAGTITVTKTTGGATITTIAPGTTLAGILQIIGSNSTYSNCRNLKPYIQIKNGSSTAAQTAHVGLYGTDTNTYFTLGGAPGCVRKDSPVYFTQIVIPDNWGTYKLAGSVMVRCTELYVGMVPNTYSVWLKTQGAYANNPDVFSGAQFTSWGDKVLACSYGNEIRRQDNPSSSFVKCITGTYNDGKGANLIDVSGLAVEPRARYISTIKNHVLIGNVDFSPYNSYYPGKPRALANAIYPDLVMWSATDNEQAWGSPAEQSISARGAGYQRLVDNYGPITGLSGGDRAFIFKERAIWTMDWTGDGWSFVPICQGTGTIFPNAICKYYDDIYFWGPNGPSRISGDKVETIAENVLSRLLYSNEQSGGRGYRFNGMEDYPMLLSAACDYQHGLVVYTYKEKNLVFNVKENRWGFFLTRNAQTCLSTGVECSNNRFTWGLFSKSYPQFETSTGFGAGGSGSTGSPLWEIRQLQVYFSDEDPSSGSHTSASFLSGYLSYYDYWHGYSKSNDNYAFFGGTVTQPTAIMKVGFKTQYRAYGSETLKATRIRRIKPIFTSCYGELSTETYHLTVTIRTKSRGNKAPYTKTVENLLYVPSNLSGGDIEYWFENDTGWIEMTDTIPGYMHSLEVRADNWTMNDDQHPCRDNAYGIVGLTELKYIVVDYEVRGDWGG